MSLSYRNQSIDDSVLIKILGLKSDPNLDFYSLQ